MNIDTPPFEEMAAILTDLDGAVARLPQEEQDEHRRCLQSVIDARRSAQRIEGQMVIA